jgi:anti-sigma-K factor RskA
MPTHQQFADDLALYALGELSDTQAAEFHEHIAECASCRREYQAMQDDFALLAMSVTGPTPPAKSRERLLGAIAAEPRMRQPRMVASRPRWWSLAPVFGAAVLAAFAILLWIENSDLRDNLNAAQKQNSGAQHDLDDARELVSTLTAADTVKMTLTAAQTKAQPQGRVFYRKQTGTLMFFASNLAPAPQKKAYELWLIPANGSSPLPAGVFKPDAKGAAMSSARFPENTDAKSFAITIEDEAGSPTATSPPVMVAQGL